MIRNYNKLISITITIIVKTPTKYAKVWDPCSRFLPESKKNHNSPIFNPNFLIVSRFEAEIYQKKIPYKVYGDLFWGVGVSSQNTEKA